MSLVCHHLPRFQSVQLHCLYPVSVHVNLKDQMCNQILVKCVRKWTELSLTHWSFFIHQTKHVKQVLRPPALGEAVLKDAVHFWCLATQYLWFVCCCFFVLFMNGLKFNQVRRKLSLWASVFRWRDDCLDFNDTHMHTHIVLSALPWNSGDLFIWLFMLIVFYLAMDSVFISGNYAWKLSLGWVFCYVWLLFGFVRGSITK